MSYGVRSLEMNDSVLQKQCAW